MDHNFDVVYIDPPYNTDATKEDGNGYSTSSKFIYNDKFSRSGWLNLMNDRLKIAKDLIKDDGMIFVSIDDNEQAYLKVLMDEIFGESNFITTFKYVKNPGGDSDNKFIANTTEYVHAYAKMKDRLLLTNDEQNIEVSQWSFNEKWNRYERKGSNLQKGGNEEFLYQRPNMGYVIYYNKKTKDIKTSSNYKKDNIASGSKFEDVYSLDNDLINQGYSAILPTIRKGELGRWRIKEETFHDRWEKDLFVIQKTKNGYQIFEYETVNIDGVKNTKPKDLIQFANNAQGTKELKAIFSDLNKVPFNYPKPTSLIEYLIKLHPNKNARILDFFAGSGTTGHAVLELNRQDGGDRTYTLITNNENNIADTITYERLYRINYGEGTQKETFDWLKKNKPYGKDLNIFEIKYENIDFKKENRVDFILKKIKEEIQYFTKTSKPINEDEILNLIRQLYVIKKD
ncbi:site-specific DNA-methyltransferase [Mycoplasma sp. 1232]|uniref:site-specific DNA-methyltransferase n=1 Tax=Mycoplasma sp. 1232 TaxID=3108527 RepID=UPI002B25D05A|nr:site-specific DNA-methyltransferase [Mycoplasma sp. 1232]MEA4333907.1 site-specific DNA-methyltransferase [Mycoplasma sp. 1232]